MSSIGFWHFAQQAPGKLALAAPDGRHWSRGELLDECKRIVRDLHGQGLQPGDRVVTTLPNCAELIALSLAVSKIDCVLIAQQADKGTISKPSRTIRAATDAAEVSAQLSNDRQLQKMAEIVQLMALFDIKPETRNVHYCGCPLQFPEAMRWAVNSLHYGHSVVLVDQWDAEGMLRAIDQYRVTTSYMLSDQFSRLLALPRELRERYDVSSTRHMIYSDMACPPAVKQSMIDWWGMSIYQCSGQHSKYDRSENPGKLINY